MKTTKAKKVWKQRYESARSVMTVFKAIEAANLLLQEETGITLRYEESGSHAAAIATLPSGETRRNEEVGYLTLTVMLRLTEDLLGNIKVKDLER